jgi:NAD(P)-dependent dehydrogenase (short-subunit alcohol dehydrogenase family)
MTGRLEGKTALITGAGSVGPGWGNGRAEAILFAREGARLLLVDRDPDALAVTVDTVRSEGGTAAVFEGDVTGSAVVGSAQVGYAAAKAGIIQMSRVIAVQHAPDRIRVNTVVPGQLHTPMVEARLAGQRAGGDVEALLAQRQSRIPIGFMGDGRDTAYAALYLASDEARFVTGTEIVVDGGMTARCD